MNLHRSPRKAIRTYCLYCTGGQKKEVESCDGNDPAFHQCAFQPYRLGKKRPSVKIMRQFCLQCMGGSKSFVKECSTTDCLVYPFRMGRNPARIGKGFFADQTRKKHVKSTPVKEGFSIQNQRSAIR